MSDDFNRGAMSRAGMSEWVRQAGDAVETGDRNGEGNLMVRVDWDVIVDKMLEAAFDPSVPHVLHVYSTGWTMKHPLACRARDLFKCVANEYASTMLRPGTPPGHYDLVIDQTTIPAGFTLGNYRPEEG